MILLIMQKPLITVILLASFITTEAQTYIGISADFGNRAKYNPKVSELRSPAAPSGSLVLLKLEEIRSGWYVQYGAGVGSLGFRIDASEADTLHSDPEFYDRYFNYTLVYLNGHLAFGKDFTVITKKISVFLGGGATYYSDMFENNIRDGVSVRYGNSFEKVFEYEMVLTDNGVKGFTEFSIQTSLNPRMLIGVMYRYHFNPALKGTYNFYHMKDPPSGLLSLTQRAFSILFLVRIGKKNPVRGKSPV